MNKWSLLLFSVLGLLLSTTSKLNFVDGGLGCCDYSSRPLLSDTKLSIYEPHCVYRSFTEIIQLISPKPDIRYDTRNNELNHLSRSDGSQRQFEGRRIPSNERFRSSSNVVFDLDDSTISSARDKKVVKETNNLHLRRNSESFSPDNFNKNHVYGSRFRNNNFLRNKMERNSRERRIHNEEELSEIRDNRFRQNDGPVSVNLEDRNQERFNRRTFVIRTYIRPNQRKNIDETSLSSIRKNKVERDVERNDFNTRQRFLRDTRLTSELSRNSDRRFQKDERSSNERYATVQSASEIGVQRNKNIREYLRLSTRSDSIVKKYERDSLTNVRRDIKMDGTIHVYRRSNVADISEDMVPDVSSLQRESEKSRNQIRDDKRQINNDFKKRSFEERYLTRGLQRQNHNMNRLQEIQQAKFYRGINIKDGKDYSSEYVERIERASDQSRKIRDNNREILLRAEYMAERITPRNKISHVEKRELSSNINRRSEAIRRSGLESRERENYRFRLDIENANTFEQRRIRQIRYSNNEDELRESRNRLIRSNAMGQEVRKNIMQICDDDNVSKGFLVREDNNREMVNRHERERLSHTDKRASQLRIIQRENPYKMHIRAKTIEENQIQEDLNFNKRLVSNTNRNVEKLRFRTNNRSDREELRNSLARETERAFDENRIRQIRDKPEYRREHRLNEGRSVERVLTRIDLNRNNVVEKGVLNIISSIGNNRLYAIVQSAVGMLRRRENYEVRSAHENERILDQRRTRDTSLVRALRSNTLERREDNLSTERLDQRNLAFRNSMNNAVLNYNRQSYNDDNDSQEILVRTIQREMSTRSERESSSVNKRSSYLRMIQRDNKNRNHNDYRQRTNIQEIRVVEYQRADTPNKILNTKNILTSENKRSFDESRISQRRDSREYRLTKLYNKVNADRVLERNIDKIIENRDSRIRSEFDSNPQNQNSKRTPVFLQVREKNLPSLMRLNEQNVNEIVINNQFTRTKDHFSNVRIAQIHSLRKINVRSNSRGSQDKVITRHVETEVKFHYSDKTHHERRTERVIRNVARNGISINNRDLLEVRSEQRRDVNRKLEYIRNVRSYNVQENNAHREIKDDVKLRDRFNSRERNVHDRAQGIRAPNDLKILNKESRFTKMISEEKREIRTAFSKIEFLPIEHKRQTNNEIFKLKLQYIIYILQGLYIIGLYTKFTENFNGIQKTSRFSNWFPLSAQL